jgi:NTE family protein
MRQTEAKTIALALQGGGAHGAFTWGVLDRLLEDGRLAIEGISGTSAGAMNAVVLADGLEKDGAKGARQALHSFWEAMSRCGSFNPFSRGPLNPLAWWFDLPPYVVSPYQLNPFNLNPLRDVLEDTIDFECARRSRRLRLYVCATNVRTSRLRVFTTPELSADVLLASASLPQIYQAVEIDGEHYWDGGFMGNPVLEPLVGQCSACDIVIVQVTPTLRDEVPRTATEIVDRANEISFNSSLMREIRAIAGVMLLVEVGALEIKDPRYRCINFHSIAAEDVMKGLDAGSKFNTDWSFLTGLRDLGHERTDRWLAENFKHLGKQSTLDLKAWQPVY